MEPSSDGDEPIVREDNLRARTHHLITVLTIEGQIGRERGRCHGRRAGHFHLRVVREKNDQGEKQEKNEETRGENLASNLLRLVVQRCACLEVIPGEKALDELILALLETEMDMVSW